MPLSPHFSPRAGGFEEDGEAEGAGSVRSKIVQGLALVKRNLAGAFGEAQCGREASAGAGEAGLQPPPPSPADLGSPARKVPAGSGPPRGGVVGCAFDIMGKKEVQALAGNHAAIAPAPSASALAPASPRPASPAPKSRRARRTGRTASPPTSWRTSRACSLTHASLESGPPCRTSTAPRRSAAHGGRPSTGRASSALPHRWSRPGPGLSAGRAQTA